MNNNVVKDYVNNNKEKVARIGNFTANAVKSFEENIVKQHNYLEKTNNK